MNKNHQPKVLIFSPSVKGGIAEHAYYQGKALEKCGAEVVRIVSASYIKGLRTDFKKLVCLPDPIEGLSGLTKKIRFAWWMILSRYILALQILKQKPDLVLIDSYVEYLAPFWIWPHLLLARIWGVRYAANLHDPIRSYQVGPAWWHKTSVWLAFLPLSFVLVHDKRPEPSSVPKGISVVQVPHGLFEITEILGNPEAVRNEWGVKEWQRVFLSFGYVRDGKNIDLAIQALKQVPDAFLVVAGSVPSDNDKPFAYYCNLASRMNVMERCFFVEGFVPDRELGRYFAGSDFVLLTYSSSFHSQSGVLNIAARARKPVLASASTSPLIESVRKYELGVTVDADSVTAIAMGMKKLISEPPSPHWDDYEAAASWLVNAQGVLHAAGLDINKKR